MKIKKFVSVMLVAVMITILFPQTMNVFAHEYSDDRVNYLVVAKNESSYNVINQEYKTELCEDKTVSDDSMVLSLTEGEAESIEEYAGTEYIEKDILFNESSEEDSTEDLLSDFLGIDTAEAEEVYPDNILMVNGDDVNIDSEENIVVGILDSGIANHDDLNVTKRVCLIPDMYVDNNLFSYDLSGHGTGVAGVIGAKNNDKGIIGIYENVELYSIQVLTPTGQAPLSRIVAGIDWAIENGVDVLNMSFGTNTNSQILYDAIVRANNSGMVLVAAAGNTESATQYPAKYSEVISVGSVDGSGNISDFSAKDSFVDIYAPGESVQTTTIVSGYTAQNGTSLAAPHVTAAAALIKAKNRQRTTADIKNLILATANKSVEENEKGILNIENMLAHANDFDYTGNQTTYQNDNVFDEYDQDAIVTGSWSGKDHALITKSIGGQNLSVINYDNLRLMASSSFIADHLYGNKVFVKAGNTIQKVYKPEFYPLHAYGYDVPSDDDFDDYPNLNADAKVYNSNYVADTKYLFRLARCYMDYTDDGVEPEASEIRRKITVINENSPGAHVEQLQNIVRSSSELYKNASHKSISITYTTNEQTNETTEDFILNSSGEEEQVFGIIYMDILDGVSETNPSARAFKILGLALHLSGDAYAHRIQVPIDSTYSGGYFYEDDQKTIYDFWFDHDTANNYDLETMKQFLKFKDNKDEICTCFYCFKSAVASGFMETRDMTPFIHAEADYYEADLHETFYPKRYTVGTARATERMLACFVEDKDFSIYTFVPTNQSYDLKLNNLKGYIIESGVNFNILSEGNRTRIEALSTDDEI